MSERRASAELTLDKIRRGLAVDMFCETCVHWELYSDQNPHVGVCWRRGAVKDRNGRLSLVLLDPSKPFGSAVYSDFRAILTLDTDECVSHTMPVGISLDPGK